MGCQFGVPGGTYPSMSFLQDSFQTEKVHDDGSKPVSAVKQGSNLPIKEQKRKSIKRNDTNGEFNE